MPVRRPPQTTSAMPRFALDAALSTAATRDLGVGRDPASSGIA